MNSRFNVELTQNDLDCSEYYTIGKQETQKHKRLIETSLKNLLQKNNFIDGDTLQRTWFPDTLFEREPYVFLSHSHADEELAISLAGYLHRNFGIQCFIDSTMWGYAGDLNALLNKCDFSNGIICHKCNCRDFTQNISYVHMMLASALMKMIYQCESVFFLNTPSSINLHHKVDSAWIYYELNLTATLPVKKLGGSIIKESAFDSRNHKIEFTASLDEFNHIDQYTLQQWRDQFTWQKGNPYEVLYGLIAEKAPGSHRTKQIFS